MRSAIVGAALLCASGGLAGCGDDEKAAVPKQSEATKSVSVAGYDYAFVMPGRITGGLVTMDFSNRGKELHEYGLTRLDPGKTAADVDRALAKGEPPAWAHDIGGVPVLTPGTRIRVTRKLRPGTYAFLCFIPDAKGRPHYSLGMKKLFTVSGDSGAASPRTDGVVVAGEKAFTMPAIRAGRQTLELRNGASAPREFQLLGLRPGKSERDAQRFFAPLEKGHGFTIDSPPPVELAGAMQSIAPGASVYVTLELKRGWRYRLADDEHHLEARFSPK